MRKTLISAAAALVLAAPAVAQTPTGEHLIAKYPAGWQTLPPVKQDNLTVVRMLPPGATPQQFDEAINVERYDGLKIAPRSFALDMVEKSRKTCEGVQVSPVDETPVNGYKAAALRFHCTKSSRSGKSGLMMVTAIAGKDALFVVQRMWLGPPVAPDKAVPVPDATIGAWDAFAVTITLCNDSDATHRCPAVTGK